MVVWPARTRFSRAGVHTAPEDNSGAGSRGCLPSTQAPDRGYAAVTIEPI